ncbi:MAG: ABC transporter permease [bacterium]
MIETWGLGKTLSTAPLAVFHGFSTPPPGGAGTGWGDEYPDPLTTVFAAVSAFLAGVFYPTTVLPPALQQVAQLLPLTHAVRGVRLAVLQGYRVTALWREILFLTVFIGIAIPLAVGAFRVAIVQAKRSGTLGAY